VAIHPVSIKGKRSVAARGRLFMRHAIPRRFSHLKRFVLSDESKLLKVLNTTWFRAVSFSHSFVLGNNYRIILFKQRII